MTAQRVSVVLFLHRPLCAFINLPFFVFVLFYCQELRLFFNLGFRCLIRGLWNWSLTSFRSMCFLFHFSVLEGFVGVYVFGYYFCFLTSNYCGVWMIAGRTLTVCLRSLLIQKRCVKFSSCELVILLFEDTPDLEVRILFWLAATWLSWCDRPSHGLCHCEAEVGSWILYYFRTIWGVQTCFSCSWLEVFAVLYWVFNCLVLDFDVDCVCSSRYYLLVFELDIL